MPEVVSLCKGPKEAYEAFADKGAELCRKPLLKVFHQAVYAGIYIGFGGMLSLVIAGGLADVSMNNPTIQSFVFAALFPVNLLIIILTGGVLFTGVSATVPAAVFEKKAHWSHIPKLLAISWIGNLIGGVIFALLVTYCDMNLGATAELAKHTIHKKCSKTFLQTLIKGIGCNWLVCMAVFLSGQAQDMAGKMVGIWFPISCFVAIGFEHVPANMFVLTMGLVAGSEETVLDALWKNMVPTTLGNFVAGFIFVALGYSYAFGELGGNNKSPMVLTRCSSEEFGLGDDLADALAANDHGLKAMPASAPEPSAKEAAKDVEIGDSGVHLDFTFSPASALAPAAKAVVEDLKSAYMLAYEGAGDLRRTPIWGEQPSPAKHRGEKAAQASLN
eukprot:CAMPEP_0177316912 /NCGR_PEP_ID=MMETSP0368-20130122/13252_1 /TAXON_ID=447022 ORGANISM="Scrippsiella hangoei-like, Strain SHHI-4" /NCGR_SAMPLE_ID=MMETSP0368 /ASSEMBLY_ACC=CAM_ASM_000363 /LENGTH=387 /DNA_ID=CAMNT_0018776223 /DNA_START=67 /DNA_END=1231 /DNA_ORIENTATION=-